MLYRSIVSMANGGGTGDGDVCHRARGLVGWACLAMAAAAAAHCRHEVFTPALTGLGERSHLASAQVDLDTHIRDVLGVLEFEDLDQVVLVGHSYGGVVITGVADRMPQRVAQLVYLDAEVPADGQCEFDLLAPEERAGYQQAAAARGQGWQIPPPVPDPLPEGLDARLRWAMSRMVSQPITTFTQPLRLADRSGAGVARTYIRCTQGKEGQELPGYVQRAGSDPAWRLVELAAGHGAHVTAPQQLADLLVELA
jgi:pimeloyl-ACP methyl ester carboxylesterase